MRILLAPSLFALVCIWFDQVLRIVDRQQHHDVKPLSDAAMVALLATTTANVIGLLLVVVNSLFPNKSLAAKRK